MIAELERRGERTVLETDSRQKVDTDAQIDGHPPGSQLPMRGQDRCGADLPQGIVALTVQPATQRDLGREAP